MTNPKERASLQEIMNHPWITKGFGGPPDNFLPHREPLQLPLDPRVIEKMEGFDFGTPEYITTQLTKTLESAEYQHAVRAAARRQTSSTPEVERKRGVFDFYKRRNSISRDTLSDPSSEGLPIGEDPVNAYNPLISIYYLAREKLEREQREANPGALGIPASSMKNHSLYRVSHRRRQLTQIRRPPRWLVSNQRVDDRGPERGRAVRTKRPMASTGSILMHHLGQCRLPLSRLHLSNRHPRKRARLEPCFVVSALERTGIRIGDGNKHPLPPLLHSTFPAPRTVQSHLHQRRHPGRPSAFASPVTGPGRTRVDFYRIPHNRTNRIFSPRREIKVRAAH